MSRRGRQVVQLGVEVHAVQSHRQLLHPTTRRDQTPRSGNTQPGAALSWRRRRRVRQGMASVQQGSVLRLEIHACSQVSASWCAVRSARNRLSCCCADTDPGEVNSWRTAAAIAAAAVRPGPCQDRRQERPSERTGHRQRRTRQRRVCVAESIHRCRGYCSAPGRGDTRRSRRQSPGARDDLRVGSREDNRLVVVTDPSNPERRLTVGSCCHNLGPAHAPPVGVTVHHQPIA
jgi:hypothetical protein